MTPHEYCLAQAAPAGSSLYYALRFAPSDRRPALAALFALQAEVEGVASRSGEPAVSRQRLLWWREELGRLPAGTPSHPVTQVLRAALPDWDLHLPLALELIDGHLLDLDSEGFATDRDLVLHSYLTSATVMLLAAEALGYTNRTSRKFAHELGVAIALTCLLRDLGQTLRQRRLHLPQTELERFDVTRARLLEPVPEPGVAPLLAHQIARARESFAQAWRHLPAEDRRALRFLVILGRLHEALLEEIADEGPAILHRKVTLTPLRQLWIAWRVR